MKNKIPASRWLSAALLVTVSSLFFVGAASASTNLLSNPGAETGNFSGWTVTNGGNGWAASNAYQHSGSYSFLASYDWGYLSQEINLSANGYSDAYMDTQPTISAGLYALGTNWTGSYADPYNLHVELRDVNHNALATYDSGTQYGTSSWVNLSHSFSSYGTGVRYVYFKMGGKDSEYWAGNYGIALDDASLTVTDGPPSLSQVTAVPSPTNDQTPNYTFSASQAGTLSYSGDCSSATTSAAAGNNTVTFNTLAEGTHSNCTITISNGNGTSSPLAVNTFTVDITPPNLGTAAVTPGQTTATVTWTTDESADSLVRYGLTAGYGLTASNGTLVTSHSVALSSLSTDTTYHYQVCSTDAAGNQSCSADGTFQTQIASPVAADDSYTVLKNGRLDVAAAGVLNNDTGAGTITAALVAGPSHAASFALAADGSFTYVPATGYVGSDTFTYHANNGFDSNLATVTVTVYSNDSTTGNELTLSRLSVSANADVQVSFTLHNTLSTALTITYPDAFTIISPFTSGSCSGGGTVDNFGMGSHTLTADKHSCSGTLTLSGAVVQNPSLPGSYTISWVNDDPGSVTVIILTDDAINVAAQVDPSFTFDVGATTSACTSAFTATTWSIPFGALDASRRVASSGAAGVPVICTVLSTNASGGAVVDVNSEHGGDGLVSASVPADKIPSAAAAIDASAPNYGLCLSTVSTDNGYDLGSAPAGHAPDGSWGSYGTPACTASTTAGAESVGGFSLTPQEVWRVTGVTQGAFATLRLKVGVSPTQPAHNDYSDVLTFVATGTY